MGSSHIDSTKDAPRHTFIPIVLRTNMQFVSSIYCSDHCGNNVLDSEEHTKAVHR